MIAVQYGLNNYADDVATVKRTLGRVNSPAILVGHSYGGATITGAGTDERVARLVYIAAVAPDVQETVQSQLNKYPTESSPKSRSRADVSGLSRKVSSTSRETFPNRSRSWSGRPTTARRRPARAAEPR